MSKFKETSFNITIAKNGYIITASRPHRLSSYFIASDVDQLLTVIKDIIDELAIEED